MLNNKIIECKILKKKNQRKASWYGWVHACSKTQRAHSCKLPFVSHRYYISSELKAAINCKRTILVSS